MFRACSISGNIDARQGNIQTAEHLFQETLRSNPDYAEALLELANLRIASKKYAEAAELLRKFVRVARSPAPGYYKLAMVERSLHQTEAAQRDLSVFRHFPRMLRLGRIPTSIFLITSTTAQTFPVTRRHNWILLSSLRRFRNNLTSRKTSICSPKDI